jgi:flagellar biosynthesis protein FliQ
VEAFESLLHATLVLAAILCLPVLAATAAIGTLIAVMCAATQVQEQTLPLLPKLCAVGVAVGVGGHFALSLCAALFHEVLIAIPAIVHGP